MSMKSWRSLWKKRALHNQCSPTATRKIKSTPLGVGALLNLLQIRVGIADPIAGSVDIALIHRFGARDNVVANFYRLGLGRFPMATEFAKPVIHRARFDC